MSEATMLLKRCEHAPVRKQRGWHRRARANGKDSAPERGRKEIVKRGAPTSHAN
jgi:hypothetical protein